MRQLQEQEHRCFIFYLSLEEQSTSFDSDSKENIWEMAIPLRWTNATNNSMCFWPFESQYLIVNSNTNTNTLSPCSSLDLVKEILYLLNKLVIIMVPHTSTSIIYFDCNNFIAFIRTTGFRIIQWSKWFQWVKEKEGLVSTVLLLCFISLLWCEPGQS